MALDRERTTGSEHSGGQGACAKADAAPRYKGQGQEKVCCHHRQQTQPADCAELARAQLHARGTRPDVEQ